jgi:hypothetical protein
VCRAFDDTLVIFPGATVVPLATHPWVRADGDRPAHLLRPGHYVAVPDTVAARLVYTIATPDGAPVICESGVFRLYSGAWLIQHIGCQVVPSHAWSIVTGTFGRRQPFDYVLVDVTGSR